jgi:hypothetical protein
MIKVRGLTAIMAVNSRNHVANISIMYVAAKFKWCLTAAPDFDNR